MPWEWFTGIKHLKYEKKDTLSAARRSSETHEVQLERDSCAQNVNPYIRELPVLKKHAINIMLESYLYVGRIALPPSLAE